MREQSTLRLVRKSQLTIVIYSILIGYGDLAASTFGGKLFTVFYALIGVPMVISILNDWGTMLFKGVSGESNEISKIELNEDSQNVRRAT